MYPHSRFGVVAQNFEKSEGFAIKNFEKSEGFSIKNFEKSVYFINFVEINTSKA